MNFLRRFANSFSAPGLIVGLAIACLSLTPSMVPRAVPVQGVLTGLVFVLGYGIGAALRGIWEYMGLVSPGGKAATILSSLTIAALVIVNIIMLGKMADWQNSIHILMGMEEVDSGYPVSVVAIAIGTALSLILIGRFLWFFGDQVVNAIARVLPYRVSVVLGIGLVGYILVTLTSGVLLRSALKAFDESFAALDRALDDEYGVPEDPLLPGSSASHINWNEIGRNGKRFVLYGPVKTDIENLLGRDAKRPIRVYAGFNTGETLEERAQAALDELMRVGGFDRSMLVVAVPTGTGWLDPGAVDTMEYMHGGDTATVSMQYSYLPSWLTLMVEPEASSRAAQALFDAVYGHWSGLPRNDRPRFYLHGLSLGAFGSADTVDFMSILSDPIDGAMWSGPPFPSRFWNQVTDGRESGSPQRLPVFRDSSVVRFMNQDGFADIGDAQWGPFRAVYLQYASDPMTFFSTSLAFSADDWLGPDRGPDVSPDLKFYPLVTFLQVAMDMAVATIVPRGYGHNFAAKHYIDAWVAVTAPRNWGDADTDKLKAYFEDFDSSPL